MNLSEFCIKRPVFTIVMMLIITIVGIICFYKLTVRHYPKIDRPVISVVTEYTGASAQVIETSVTQHIERALSGLGGLDYMNSISRTGESVIKLYLYNNVNLDDAAADIRDKLSRVYTELPPGAKYPTIKKADAEAEAFMSLVLLGDNHDLLELKYQATKNIKDILESIPGVASVDIDGGHDMAMHLRLDPRKLSAYNLSSHDVIDSLKKNDVEIPVGQLKNKDRSWNIKASAKLHSVRDFSDLVVGQSEGSPIRLRDVGVADFAPVDQKRLVFFNGKPAVSIAIFKKSVANPVNISNEISHLLPKLTNKLPSGVEIRKAYDQTDFVKTSINEVYKTIVEAIICIFIIITIFLWSFRAAIIPLITIPICLVATFCLLYVFDCSINILTLLAMVLAIGLVVDDAIVMLENIHRHIESGLPVFKAAIKGSKEIKFPIIAMTLTLASVYTPIAFSQGEIGKLFSEFAITLAGSVLISGFVALTLSPMMCAYCLGNKKPTNRLIDKCYNFLQDKYFISLRWTLLNKKWVIIITLLFTVIGILISAFILKSEVIPNEDQGEIMVMAHPPSGVSLEYVKKYSNQLQNILNSNNAIKDQITMVDPYQVQSWVKLKDWENRKTSNIEVIDNLRPEFNSIPGLNVYASANNGFIKSSGGGKIKFMLLTTQSFNMLHASAMLLERELIKEGVIRNLMMDYGNNEVQWDITIDRNKASALGVSVDKIAQTLEHFLAERRIGNYDREGDQFDIQISLYQHHKQSPHQLRNLYVQSESGNMIPLSQLITIKNENTPAEIRHFNRLKAITISGELSSNYSLSDAVKTLNTLSEKILPKSVTLEFSGEMRSLVQSNYSVWLIFGLSLLFIYLVMAAQFENFKDPFLIMFSVPLAITGGILALYFFGGSFNIYTQIGFITLIGLITKHGILIIDFARTYQKEGEDLLNSVLKASNKRLRPILMTTLAMIGSSIPLMVSFGASSESRYQLGLVIFWGMLFGTLLTLYVLPILYVLFSKKYKVKI